MADLRVLIIGGSGVFGSRLARLAVEEPGIALTLAGRNQGRLDAVAGKMTPLPAILVLDRDRIEGSDLEPFDLVIDAAGPFQASHSQVVVAALTSRTPYLDLADGRQFVLDFPGFDDAAKRRNVPLVTGASSIPALSHAVLDQMVQAWRKVENIRIGIYPGNRAPRGLSVVEAILSYVGRPVRIFRNGVWQNASGWGMTHREEIPGIGKRWASICETPEQDLLVERYRPEKSAEFFAGLELGILHLGLALCAQPVRWGWTKNLRPLARPMLAVARMFRPFGSDRGAMTVRASGRNHAGRPVEAKWVLRADAGRGPYVPVFAALAMIRRFRDGRAPESGAHICSGILSLAEFEPEMARLGMICRHEENPAKSVVHKSS